MVSGQRVPRRRGIAGRWWWGESEIAATPFREWKLRDSVGGAAAAVSSRKLAASLWRLAAASHGGGSVRWKCGLLFDRLGFEFCSSASIPKSAEGVTKWDYCNSRAWGDFSHFESKKKRSSTAYPERVNELERVRSVIKKLVDDIKKERKICRKMDIVNLKLLRDTAVTKLSTRRFIQNLQMEKKARVELQEVCENLVKEIEGTKAQLEALRNQRKTIQLEVEEERKMLQISEVWKEEQAQKKIADAKLVLDDKYAEISNRVDDLNPFFRILNPTGDANVMRKDKVLRPDVRSMMFKFPKSDKEFAIIKDSKELKENAHNGLGKPGASQISSLSLMQSKKKGSSSCKILRAWSRSKKDTCKAIKTDGSSDRSVCSNVSMVSPQRLVGERELEVRRNPHVIRAMKGHIEWPRKIRRRGLAGNLLEAKFAGEKTLLRNALRERS